MPAGYGDDRHPEIGEDARGRVVESGERVHVAGGEDRGVVAAARLVDVGPVEGASVRAKPQPDGAVARPTDVRRELDLVAVVGRVAEHRRTSVVLAPVHRSGFNTNQPTNQPSK